MEAQGSGSQVRQDRYARDLFEDLEDRNHVGQASIPRTWQNGSYCGGNAVSGGTESRD